MATLGDLKSRVIGEIDRDDMDSGDEAEDRLTDAINSAIRFYSDRKFWFMNDDGSVSTTSGTGYVIRPYAVRIARDVVYSSEKLEKVPLSDIEGRTETGQPTHWADNGDFIQLWPIPDASYALSVYGATQIDAPESANDETVWTNEAYDLIAARVKYLLFRDTFRDVEGAQLAKEAEREELDRLLRETRARSVTPLRSGVPWTNTTFNINRGY